ncbi:hypothetical protein WMF31_27960 [Sorangium sp. So ce1036]|uniref:hypothetical protein n=1 Tax=Sorangium sp. So ce1036 TaxID=3133328 RepID=UPI003F1169C4
MSAAGLAVTARPLRPAAGGFFLREYLRVLGGRQARLMSGFMLYGIVGLPVVLGRPDEEMLSAVRAWFGGSQLELKLFLFAWFDLAMNKIAIFSAALLGAGIITDERSKGMLDIYLAKPISLMRYFVVKVLAAAAAMATLHGGATLAGALFFGRSVRGFALAPYLLMSFVHLFAAVFATIFAGVMAVSVRRKPISLLTSVVVLSALVSLAFVGFYNPSLRAISVLNPLYHGVALIDTAEAARARDAVAPVLWLAGYSALALAYGARRAAALAGEE